MNDLDPVLLAQVAADAMDLLPENPIEGMYPGQVHVWWDSWNLLLRAEVLLGSFASLDPCGLNHFSFRWYHPSTYRCRQWWDELEAELERHDLEWVSYNDHHVYVDRVLKDRTPEVPFFSDQVETVTEEERVLDCV